jgi:hypothetical protein
MLHSAIRCRAEGPTSIDFSEKYLASISKYCLLLCWLGLHFESEHVRNKFFRNVSELLQEYIASYPKHRTEKFKCYLASKILCRFT